MVMTDGRETLMCGKDMCMAGVETYETNLNPDALPVTHMTIHMTLRRVWMLGSVFASIPAEVREDVKAGFIDSMAKRGISARVVGDLDEAREEFNRGR